MLIVEVIDLLLEFVYGWHDLLVEVLQVIVEAVPVLQLLLEYQKLAFIRLGLPSVSDGYLNSFNGLEIYLSVVN